MYIVLVEKGIISSVLLKNAIKMAVFAIMKTTKIKMEWLKADFWQK